MRKIKISCFSQFRNFASTRELITYDARKPATKKTHELPTKLCVHDKTNVGARACLAEQREAERQAAVTDLRETLAPLFGEGKTMKRSELAKKVAGNGISMPTAYRLLDTATAKGLLQFNKLNKTYQLCD